MLHAIGKNPDFWFQHAPVRNNNIKNVSLFVTVKRKCAKHDNFWCGVQYPLPSICLFYNLCNLQNVERFDIGDLSLNLDNDETSFLILVWADAMDVGKVATYLKTQSTISIQEEVVYANKFPSKAIRDESNCK